MSKKKWSLLKSWLIKVINKSTKDKNTKQDGVKDAGWNRNTDRKENREEDGTRVFTEDWGGTRNRRASGDSNKNAQTDRK